MPESMDLSSKWQAYQEQLKSIERRAIDADFSMRQAILALKAYRLHKLDSKAPFEVDYSLVLELINELDRITRIT